MGHCQHPHYLQRMLFAQKLFSDWSGPEHNPEIGNPKLPTNKKKHRKSQPVSWKKARAFSCFDLGSFDSLAFVFLTLASGSSVVDTLGFDDAPVSDGAAISSWPCSRRNSAAVVATAAFAATAVKYFVVRTEVLWHGLSVVLRCIPRFHRALKRTSQGPCCHRLSVAHSTSSPNSPHHTTTSHHIHITSHPMPLHHITPHQITSHDSTSRHITRHYITSRHNTWHHMTWHDTTSYHVTSRNQPHYLTSRHLTANHITSSHFASNHMTSYHTTSHHHRRHHANTTSHHQNITTRKPPPNGTAEGWGTQKTRFGQRTHSVYRQILSLAYMVLPPETSAPGSPGNY